MDSMSVGLGAIHAAQMGLEVVGNNIANAATEGYHRQKVDFTTGFSREQEGFILGGGVQVAGISRTIDTMLENELARQGSLAGQLTAELTTLISVEAALGELYGKGGLNHTIDEFFAAWQNLSENPAGQNLQIQVLRTAETMSSQFRMLGTFLADLQAGAVEKAGTITSNINSIAEEIAELNFQIQTMSMKGYTANNLMDQRDMAVMKLAELAGITTVEREHGVVDISMGGIWLVVGKHVQSVDVELQEGGQLAVAASGSTQAQTNLSGGELGACFSLQNTYLAGLTSDLNLLADEIMQTVNGHHVQGIGSFGSFTELTGSQHGDTRLSQMQPPVSDGTVYVRVTDSATGLSERTAVQIDASDTLETAATKLSAVNGVNAWVQGGRLNINSDAGFTFDFIPGIIPEPKSSALGGTSHPTLSGSYTGGENDEWTFEILQSGEVGNTDNLQIRVTNGSGEVINTVNVGVGYAAGDEINVGQGVKLVLGSGQLNAGESFRIDVIARSDTSGLLQAAGINTFFTGKSAREMNVAASVQSDPARIAGSLGVEGNDNANAIAMSRLRDQASERLNGMTVGGFYQEFVSGVGREISMKSMRLENVEGIQKNLNIQRENLSGVNVNDEAALMLVFERMFQAAAKYLNTVQSQLDVMMQLL